MDGMAEEPAEFRHDQAFAGSARFRRIAGIGPVYEVVDVRGDQVTARLLERDETFIYPLVDAKADPLA